MQGFDNGGPTAELARLAHARPALSPEGEEGARWAEARISHLTGGDKVTARFLHQNPFDFYPKFKLFFTANHKPRVSGSSRSGLWRRIMVVPIERVIPENERDPALSLRLQSKECREAILAWAVAGALKWMKDHENGQLMAVPSMVKDEVEMYRTEADHVLQFVKETLVTYTEKQLLTWEKKELRVADKAGIKPFTFPRVACSIVYEAYLGWCAQNGLKQHLTRTSFNRRLKEAGFETKTAKAERAKSKVTECWCNVSLNLPQKA